MSDSRSDTSPEPVHISIDSLPSDVAQQLREAQRSNPDLLRRILLYGINHKTVFETLSRSWPA